MSRGLNRTTSLIIGCALGATLAITGTALIARDAQKPTPGNIPLDDVQRFSTALSQIKSYYVKPVDDKALFEDAIRGMLTGLDPHSAYLDEDDFRELTATTQGEFGGLGIEVTMEKGYLKVISPLDDTPATKAGIKAGDYIIRIDNKAIKDLTLRDAVNLMRGPKDSEVKLTILRKGESKPLLMTLHRDLIQIKTVKSRLIDGKYGYIRISHFQKPTVPNMLEAIKKLKEESHDQLAGVVLDLRNNPGGLLDSAIDMSDAFITNDNKPPEELIVYTQGRLPGSEFRAVAKPGDVLNNAPMVVLINGGSASGSEIVAGALQDNKRAVIVGTRSFGKGSVQTVLPLDNKRGIKLTTALYFTPSGRSIQAEGINPDIVVQDIKVPRKLADASSEAIDIKESDLNGHLGNGNGRKDGEAQNLVNTDADLVYEDYQLFEALNLLKGMVASHK